MEGSGEALAEQQQSYHMRPASLSSTLCQRDYQHALGKMRQARQSTLETLAQLQQTIDLVGTLNPSLLGLLWIKPSVASDSLLCLPGLSSLTVAIDSELCPAHKLFKGGMLFQALLYVSDFHLSLPYVPSPDGMCQAGYGAEGSRWEGEAASDVAGVVQGPARRQ